MTRTSGKGGSSAPTGSSTGSQKTQIRFCGSSRRRMRRGWRGWWRRRRRPAPLRSVDDYSKERKERRGKVAAAGRARRRRRLLRRRRGHVAEPSVAAARSHPMPPLLRGWTTRLCSSSPAWGSWRGFSTDFDADDHLAGLYETTRLVPVLSSFFFFLVVVSCRVFLCRRVLSCLVVSCDRAGWS